MTKPLLSIGIIFKNEIRCLERCLKSLQPLRDALSCELVMADTGSTDGSREVAERYANILFDFPWTNDFSAARNAVIDRCSGKWYMSIDCDEWLDPNIKGIITFLTTDRDFNFASVIIRNYDTIELEAGGRYSDFLAVRLLRLSTGIRYEGTIHEHWPYKGDLRTMLISEAVFHHDGYVFQDSAKLEEKQKRNMELLQKQLEASPNNLVILTQCIESGDNTPKQEEYLHRAITGVEEKWSQWELFGPPIYRYAVRFALAKKLPELEEWIYKAKTLFPTSIFTRVEIAYYAFGNAWNKDDYTESIYWGEQYLQGVEDYQAGRFNRADILASSLNKSDSHSRLSVAIVLASGYLHEKQPEKCLQLMEKLDGRELDGKQSGDCVRNLCNLYAHFGVETASLLKRLWNEINEPIPNQARADQRRNAFLQVGEGMFEGSFIKTEKTSKDFIHHTYTTFLPLADSCELGTAAVMLETEECSKLGELLDSVEALDKLPIQSLYHAIQHDVSFPPNGRLLKIEEMDILTRRMAQDKEALITLALNNESHPETCQGAIWIRGLMLTAISVFDWKDENHRKDGIALARAYAQAERTFLPLCYSETALQKENLAILPPMHRFGWYLIRAFEALDTGDSTMYVRLLREGLNSTQSVKPMVEFLMNYTPQLQAPPSDELRTLAEQIRIALAQFPPDHPAVTTLKTSEAYQKVAYLIEGAAAPVFGAVPQ